ncbi:MAG: hypothetical protein ACJ788_03255 [Ktedonobacteraceae bacterium]
MRQLVPWVIYNNLGVLSGAPPEPEPSESLVALGTAEGIVGTQTPQIIKRPSARRAPYRRASTSTSPAGTKTKQGKLLWHRLTSQ